MKQPPPLLHSAPSQAPITGTHHMHPSHAPICETPAPARLAAGGSVPAAPAAALTASPSALNLLPCWQSRKPKLTCRARCRAAARSPLPLPANASGSSSGGRWTSLLCTAGMLRISSMVGRCKGGKQRQAAAARLERLFGEGQQQGEQAQHASTQQPCRHSTSPFVDPPAASAPPGQPSPAGAAGDAGAACTSVTAGTAGTAGTASHFLWIPLQHQPHQPANILRVARGKGRGLPSQYLQRETAQVAVGQGAAPHIRVGRVGMGRDPSKQSKQALYAGQQRLRGDCLSR